MLDPLASVLVCSIGWGISPIFAKKSMENMNIKYRWTIGHWTVGK